MNLQVNSCCFEIDLRTGSLIIGCLCLVGNMSILITLTLCFLGLAFIELMGEDSVLWPGGKDERIHDEIKIQLITIPIYMAAFIVNLVFTSFLVVGVQKRKQEYVKAYLIFESVFIAFCIIMNVILAVRGAPTCSITFYFFVIFIITYFLLVIRSYYLKMDNPEKEPVVIQTV